MQIIAWIEILIRFVRTEALLYRADVCDHRGWWTHNEIDAIALISSYSSQFLLEQ
jgi:hypothetical protein